MYLDAGLRLFKLGEHAWVELADFSLQGPRRANAAPGRESRRTRGPVVRDPAAAQHVAERLPELQRVSDAWLAHHRTGEKGFSLGAFDPKYIRRQPVALALKDGQIAAFTTLLGTTRKADASVDLMRHLPDAPRAPWTIYSPAPCCTSATRGTRASGSAWRRCRAWRSIRWRHSWHRWGRLLFNHGEYFYNFQGLRSFKEKFDPVWEPRYLATGGALPLMTLADIALLISGGLRAAVSK